MSISTKVTYITTVISAIILAIVLIFIYSTIQNLIIKSTKADLLESARLPMMRHMRKDIYLLKDGILISDPYGLGIMNKNGKIKINDRVYLFVKPYQNTIIAKDITSIENFILNIKKRFITLFIFSTLLISFSTYLITKNSMKHLKNFVIKLSKLKGTELNYRFAKPNTKDEVDELVEKFNELMDKVEKNYKLQEEFVSNVSHELKTPIANLIGYSKMLQRWGMKDKEILKESVENIFNTALNMKELVENMIIISKRYDLETEKVNLKPFVEKIVPKEVKISGNGTIIANKDALEIVIKNLVNNALTHGKAPVEVYLYENKIEIKDSGNGISDDLKNKIFEKFSKSRKSKGHGLGLYIVKKLCDQMGLNVYLKDCKHTTFVIERGEKHED
ncbi:histidine kinase [Thermosipho melanesiensis]|uniref:histidine kinase n=2 Tax=Thermosipho melanesiensis TaxID=46541 RepID=A6LJS4_THEM4|nr:HAMP domain-containing sensor histidine kinase [Thermosipho melanesiensis]ABR30175.1 integral membrane sensor signal transduction histidine kinase [Thermosipho melanesiensis BI429]APT73375.1 histidine kinase [Thermosipho melanesiensis]OOC38190.1 histidine kinase [Thermosipho melanesiensis]OOC40111.1 histidine kinase [Thermosipho melanesiensis]OOC40163.1 histidine kinase [Thermosipho melanesiensis]